MPRGAAMARGWTPQSAARPPPSKEMQWAAASQTTSSPGRVSVPRQTWLAMVPEGTKRPASLPSSSATVACSRLTVGSSPKTSSPTSARAMAARMASVGLVTVSERRSMGVTRFSSSGGRRC